MSFITIQSSSIIKHGARKLSHHIPAIQTAFLNNQVERSQFHPTTNYLFQPQVASFATKPLSVKQSTSTPVSWASQNVNLNIDIEKPKEIEEERVADHSWRQVNRIWSEDEIQAKMATRNLKHIPVTLSDKVVSTFMKTLYHSFNFITGYKAENPSPKSIEWRLIILESFAGVPGMLAASFRHFYSLRTLKRDHGSIYTFLEEAENERMHLLVCLKMFNASPVTKALCVTAQLSMTPVLMMTYMIKPAAMHRFVGYLEETAVETYANIVEHCETDGTKLNEAWSTLDAPSIGKVYWNLEDDATWVTCLKHMLADEAHHRDVNHTFATLPEGSDNPFIQEHMENFDRAAIRRTGKILNNALNQEGLTLGTTQSKKALI
jgi:hypothetical protein